MSEHRTATAERRPLTDARGGEMLERRGTRGDDLLEGSAGPDRLLGIAGADRLFGRGGDDFLQGGAGDDALAGGDGDDTASYADAAPNRTEFFTYGVNIKLAADVGTAAGLFYQAEPGRERDALREIENALGSPFNDRIAGDARGNALSGGAGDDLLFANAGPDQVRGGEGNDDLDGGDGHDALHGGGGDDFLFGKGGVDRVEAGAGDDRITGGPGRDVLIGGGGDDIFFDASLIAVTTGDGSDVIVGGGGLDTVDYTDDEVAVAVDLRRGGARQGSEVDGLVEIEAVAGTGLDDTIAGDATSNVLEGGFGGDNLAGRGGNDVLTDAAGGGVLDGGGGDDELRGGAGEDLLRGGAGRDTLRGDTGDGFGFDDRLALGDDGDADAAGFELYRESFLFSGVGVDRVTGFDEARDRLTIDLYEDLTGFDAPDAERNVVDVRDFLDSDDNGRLAGADREVSSEGADLVLDLAAVYERALGSDFFDGSDHQIVLEEVGAAIDASRVAMPTVDPTGDVLVREDFML